jgi:hypothetical protein
VQTELVEPVAHDERDALRHVTLAGVLTVHPIADERGLERAPLHAAQADLADEDPVVTEHPEAVGGIEVALAVPRTAARPEGIEIGDGVGASRVGQRLPRLEPVTAPLPHGPPCGMVGAPQWPQEQPWSRQHGSLVAHGG